MLSTKTKVVVFYPVPESRANIGQIALKKFAFEPNGNMQKFTSPIEFFIQRAGPVVKLLDEIKAPNLFRVRPHMILCKPTENNCANILDGTALYSDDNHLSLAGVELIIPLFRNVLDEAIALENMKKNRQRKPAGFK